MAIYVLHSFIHPLIDLGPDRQFQVLAMAMVAVLKLGALISHCLVTLGNIK